MSIFKTGIGVKAKVKEVKGQATLSTNQVNNWWITQLDPFTYLVWSKNNILKKGRDWSFLLNIENSITGFFVNKLCCVAASFFGRDGAPLALASSEATCTGSFYFLIEPVAIYYHKLSNPIVGSSFFLKQPSLIRWNSVPSY